MSAPDSSTPIKELRRLIAEAGLSAADCVEKQDLVERALQAHALLGKKKSNSAEQPAAASKHIRKIGSYECIIAGLETGRAVDGIVTVLHGFGATYNDFVPLISVIEKSPPLVGKNLVFVFPQAPTSPRMMGAAGWWEIDVMKWVGAMQLGDAGIARLIREKPPGLDECRQKIGEMILEIQNLVRGLCPANEEKIIPFVLGGFSQGGMTALDAALAVPDHYSIDHVMMLSSAPIVVDEWAEKLKLKGQHMKVLITHGHADQVLPFAASGWSRDLLMSHGADVKYETHGGAHELGGGGVITAICDFVAEAVNKPPRVVKEQPTAQTKV